MRNRHLTNGRRPESQGNTVTISGDHEAFERDFRPRGDLVLLKLHETGKTSGGIALPDGVGVGPQKATVLRVGPGRLTEEGKRYPVDAVEGEVVFPWLQGRPPVPIQVGSGRYILVAADSLCGTSVVPSAEPQLSVVG